jgi:hypothetical protein
MRAAALLRLASVASLLALVSACGPSLEPEPVKTPDQLLAEQEALGDEQIRKQNETDNGVAAEETDAEKKKQFDEKQTELELKRAARSAETCASVVTEAGPSGVAKTTLVFGNDGHVKTATVAPPFTDTAIGKCVLRAMQAVIVPPFVGAEVTKDWDVDVSKK